MNSISREYIRYVILLSHVSGRSFTEELIRVHVAHLKKLDEEGKLVLCGPFSDYRGGMIIIRAQSFEEARTIAESDPFVKAGVENYEIRTLQVSCKENKHLGVG